MPGQLVDVTVALANITNAIVVPRVAVNIGPDSQYVYVVTPEHVVEQHPVKVLFDDGVNMAIQSDIKPGDNGDHRWRAARLARRQGDVAGARLADDGRSAGRAQCKPKAPSADGARPPKPARSRNDV